MTEEFEKSVEETAEETVEQPEAEPAEPEETEEEEEESGDDTPAPPKPTGVQKRIAELTRNWRETERDRDYWRDLAVKKPEPTPEPPKPEATPPKEEEFDDYNEFLRAEARFTVRQEIQAALQRLEQSRRQAEEQSRQQQQQQTIQQKLQDTKTKGQAAYSDFDEVAYLPKNVVPFLPYIENPVDFAYYLGKNPEENTRITQLVNTDQRKALYEIAKLETKIGKQLKTTKAPPPPKPVKGKSSTVSDHDKLSTEEWVRLRNEGKIK